MYIYLVLTDFSFNILTNKEKHSIVYNQNLTLLDHRIDIHDLVFFVIFTPKAFWAKAKFFIF